ncbi:MAG: cyclic nucleotide-binding domain-containing protein [Mariprofundaceae bacterium]|nr:cyclic nucleotide-binding domain-containing protein [Mariprofundaceae bacterium]
MHTNSLSVAEAEVFSELRESGERGLRAQVRSLVNQNNHLEAARIFAALAVNNDTDVDISLRAARSYQRAGSPPDAGRWFLETAERYAVSGFAAQAMATLRLYREMVPDAHEGPRRIFRICRGQEGMRKDFFDVLSDRDRVGYRMRGEELFDAFDDTTFDVMLDSMNFLTVPKGEALIRQGDAATSLFILAKGRMSCHMDVRGRRHLFGNMEPGDMYGEVSYFAGGKRTADVLAEVDSEALELPFSALDALQDSTPEFKARIEALYRRRMLDIQLAVAPVFRDLEVEHRTKLASRLQTIDIPAGDVLFREDEKTTDVYLLRQGSVSLNMDVHGVERQLKLAGSGSIVGEMALVVGRRTATARAVSDCKVMQLGAKHYEKLFAESPELQGVLQLMKQEQMNETLEFMKPGQREEDYSENLLRAIWE